jgi:hypothetical protein
MKMNVKGVGNETYRFDCMVACILKLLDIIGSDSMLL